MSNLWASHVILDRVTSDTPEKTFWATAEKSEWAADVWFSTRESSGKEYGPMRTHIEPESVTELGRRRLKTRMGVSRTIEYRERWPAGPTTGLVIWLPKGYVAESLVIQGSGVKDLPTFAYGVSPLDEVFYYCMLRNSGPVTEYDVSAGFAKNISKHQEMVEEQGGVFTSPVNLNVPRTVLETLAKVTPGLVEFLLRWYRPK